MTSALWKALHHQTTCSTRRPDARSLCLAVNCHYTCLGVEYFLIAFQPSVLFVLFLAGSAVCVSLFHVAAFWFKVRCSWTCL